MKHNGGFERSPTPLEGFFKRVVERPGDPAVIGGGRQISYAELAMRALDFAAAVRAVGETSPGEPEPQVVGIAMAPSADCIAAVLGVMQAGYAYLPLDPESLPGPRRKAILEDSRPGAILADMNHAGALQREGRVIVAETLARNHGLGSLAQLRDPLGADDLAYIIYTSGSTGVPKGVAMRYGALWNLVSWQLGHERLGAAARTLCLTPLSFDVSFQEIMGCLASGGALVVVEPSLRKDPIGLARRIHELEVERVYLPYVGLQNLAEAACSTSLRLKSLKDVVTAGEQLHCSPEIVELFQGTGGAALHNHYGPAETHVVTAHTLVGDPGLWPRLPPIGMPVANVEVLILNEAGALAPLGEIGEIYLGGACLARGYLNRSRETSERFLPHPFDSRSSRRVYRTGDLGRKREDGLLEWIGRNDHQIKIRGHRVELGDVEAALVRHPEVRQAVVMPREVHGRRDLVAYLRLLAEESRVGEARGESLQGWRAVWNRTYGVEDLAADPAFDLSGWNSSYSGKPIPIEDMREWVDQTVGRILTHAPRRILEIGCGTGLLLFRLAPACEQYVGLDFSEEAVARLNRHIPVQPELREKVTVLCREAHDLGGFADGSFDLVVMNSVLQHFPGPDYLLDVLRQCVRIVSAPGAVFVGDVFPLSFREAFFASLEQGRADGGARPHGLRERVNQRLKLDRELLVDPEFFSQLQELVPGVGWAEIQLKRGSRRNELIDFRYDVTLHVGAAAGNLPEHGVSWGDLEVQGRTPAGLLEVVARGVCVHGVPNPRTSMACSLLPHARQEVSVAGGASGSSPQDPWSLDPEAMFSEARKRGLDVELSPSGDMRTYRIRARPGLRALDVRQGPAPGKEAWDRLFLRTSDPSRDRVAKEVIPRVRQHVTEQLPDYMRPSAYVVMAAFPTTTSGKIDRRSLPDPGQSRPDLASPYVAPRSSTEEQLEAVWRQVLRLDSVGVEDSFFDLGGSSGLVLELVVLLGRELGREVSVLSIFEYPTIRALAGHLDGVTANSVDSAKDRGEMTRRAYGRRPRRKGGTP
ncbi:MAG: amino acid adenylation domain-containing protein [Chromatiales bacterium]|nr:amino acid adenylation domain-containing protein [Chromatiales bacterium]